MAPTFAGFVVPSKLRSLHLRPLADPMKMHSLVWIVLLRKPTESSPSSHCCYQDETTSFEISAPRHPFQLLIVSSGAEIALGSPPPIYQGLKGDRTGS